ncbi:dihydroorotate oxidase electron transfer subunit [Wenjunlia vitaminophila]|uniref:Dihydroorotate oxidase electron transfer subunit n=1 Tax=Wenjunlia vitaminophila TaxID=76728 RepID=A0A0T6LT23_WENVI|nr:hypothetical protein [Wenjunlia vitaminophila]KRV49261.1 dihydroorotate oxidase electron transfer subunit [Wenjunlia vitaminophila]
MSVPNGWTLAPVGGPRPGSPTWDRAEVVENAPVGDRHYRMRLAAPTITASARPGQFVMVSVPEETSVRAVLPRPMAIHRRHPTDGQVEIVYGVRGVGTQALSQVPVGGALQVVGPLGRGFDLAPETRRLLLVGRGIGVCSLMTCAEDAVAAGVEVTAVVSARTRDALVGASDYRELGISRLIEVTDEEGDSDPHTVGALLRDALDEAPAQQVLTCGSERLTALCARLADRWAATLQVSLEAHMACGLGYCHGCATAATTAASESALICADGPVFAVRREGRVSARG